MEEYKFEKLKRYYEDLKISDKNDLFYNTDRMHNALVMSCILDKSQNVKMYCGEFSLFRKEFKDKVNNNFTPEQEEEFSPIKILYASLKSFLNKEENKIYVIIENETDSLIEEPVYQEIIKDHIAKTIFIYKIDSSFKANYHFTIGDDKRYRRETGRESHSAICSMNDKDGAKIMLNQFAILQQNSTLIFNN